MSSLMLADLNKASTDPVGEASLFEGSLIKLGECTGVEGVFKVLEGERILEDLSCRGRGVARLERNRGCESDERGEDGEELHVEEKNVEGI